MRSKYPLLGCISWQSLPSNFLPPRYEHTMVITPDGQPLVYAGAHENGPIQDMWKYNQGHIYMNLSIRTPLN